MQPVLSMAEFKFPLSYVCPPATGGRGQHGGKDVSREDECGRCSDCIALM